jgi:rubredoxin
MSDEIPDTKSCPRCNARLKKEFHSYMVAVRGNGKPQSFMIGCEGGAFCPMCPTVVIDSKVFEKIISEQMIYQDVQSQKVEYALVGMLDLEAIPEEKWDIPLGDDDNPIPLIEFERASTELELIEEMENHLPIPVYPSKELCQLLCQQGKDIDINTELKITKVFDSGDAGGIVCSIIEENKQVFVVSLTHLRINPEHPLSEKILAYQKQRIKNISGSRKILSRRRKHRRRK